MPLYEYKCQECGQVFEVIQKFSDAPLQTHAACGGLVERLLSASAFQFKGSGFYITDYTKKNGSSTNGKSESNGGSAPKPAETKTESKPATTTDSSVSKS